MRATGWIRQVVTVLGIAYAGALVGGALFYRRLLYPAAGRKDAAPPADASLLTCAARDGTPVHALELRTPSGGPSVVYFHGNGEVVGDDVWLARELVRRGFHVVLAEYRGYGLSAPGQPTEAGLYADAEAVLDQLGERGVPRARIVLWGMSLGTGVAVEMARRGRGGALVLVAPYTSIVDVAARWVPFLPVRKLMQDRFDSIAKAGELALPTLVFHGTADEVVPFAMGRTLAERIPGARFVPVDGGRHTDTFVGPGQRYFDVVRDFVATASAKAAP